MVLTVNTSSTNSAPDENSDNEWTIIPVKPKLLVSFPRHPAQPTLHMLLLHSYFPMSTNKWIWNCYLDDEVLSPNPRGRERSTRIQKAFTKSGAFFAERGIVLHSLNVSTSRIVELFFGSEEDLWKADALVQEYSQAMAGVRDRIRRKENVGKLVCHGVHCLEQFADEFVGRWNLREERLRELEDMNPVFDSRGKRVVYRIRYVHYMSSQSSSSHLLKYGATWSVTFSDFRVAECFVDGCAEFNFFMDPCIGGLGWYQENPPRSFPDPQENGWGSLSTSGSASCNSGDDNHTSSTPMAKLIGQTNIKQPNRRNQQNTSQGSSASDNTTSIAGGHGAECIATANDTAKSETGSAPVQEVLDKPRRKRAAARKRKLEKKRAEKTASTRGAIGASRGGGT